MRHYKSRQKHYKTLMVVIRHLDDERESADDESCQRKGLREMATRGTK
jgi:hypothetical protein